jgi:hypothetical protein
MSAAVERRSRVAASTAEPVAEPGPARSWPAALAAGALPLAAAIATLHPGLPAGDSGELITAAVTGGIAHPPGYPLYVLLAGAWAHAIPWGAPAWRLDLLSAVAMGAASALLAAAVARTSGSRIAGVFAGWAFGLSLPAWRYAVVAEVFAPNAALAAATLWLAVGGVRGRSAVAGGLLFLCALALSLHHTLLLLALPLAVMALRSREREPGRTHSSPPAPARLALAVLLGLLPLLHLVLASGRSAALRWGDASTFRGFASLLLRAEYGTLHLEPAQSGLHADRSHLAIFLASLPREVGWVPLALAAVGAIVLARRSRPLAGALAAYAALQSAFFLRVGFPSDAPWLLGVIERFYILPLVVIGFLAGLGAAWALAHVRGSVRALAAAALLLAVALPALPRADEAGQRGNRFTETLGRGVLLGLPPDAVLFVQGDLLHNALEYLTRVERLRPDVTIVDQELLTYPWYVRQLRARDPRLLPRLDRAQRITLRDGGTLEGLAIPRIDASVDLLVEDGARTLPEGDIVRIAAAPAESLYRSSRAGFRTGWPLERGEDRYSGLPGSRNLVWFDHLMPHRPIAIIGPKDDSYALRDTLTPVGFAAWVRPRSAPPAIAEQAEVTMRLLESVSLAPYFRAYAPTSFELAERWRFAAVAARAALVASQPEAAAAIAAHPLGHAKLLAFASRFESLDPTPDPSCLRAIGFLRAMDPPFRDLTLARRDLERWLASGAPGASGDAEASARVESIRAAGR